MAKGALRVIAGALKGRRLSVPEGDSVRPTSDRLRETLFNVLGPTVHGTRVLDGFAGTGALGIEAMSRGAVFVAFIERDRATVKVLEENVERCGIAEAVEIEHGDFGRTSTFVGQRFDLVLLDPPYDVVDLQAVVDAAAPLITEGGRVVLEHRRRRTSPESSPGLTRVRVLEAGDSALSFYRSTAGAHVD